MNTNDVGKVTVVFQLSSLGQTGKQIAAVKGQTGGPALSHIFS
jgi:hypothetical protein